MVLSTVTPEGRPNSRALLFYGLDPEDNLIFFTNTKSRKGNDIAKNPFASALFLLVDEAGVQIRVDGTVEKASKEQTRSCGERMPGMARVLGSCGHGQSKDINSLEEYKASLSKAFENSGKVGS